MKREVTPKVRRDEMTSSVCEMVWINRALREKKKEEEEQDGRGGDGAVKTH